MSDFRPTNELSSVLDHVRAKVKSNTEQVSVREAITAALAEVNDLRFIFGRDSLTEEEMEWIREQFEEQQDCARLDN